MTDEELIARLRDSVNGEYDMTPHGADVLQAADRIEALIAERDEAELREKLAADKAVEYLERAEAEDRARAVWKDRAYQLQEDMEGMIEAAEAKLAENEVRLGKAVEALLVVDALDPESLVGGCSRDALSGLVNRMGDKARATLAEIKGEQDGV